MRTAPKLSILALGIAIAATIGASAQTLGGDTRPVTLVVPIAAGGGGDTIGRIFAAHLAGQLPPAGGGGGVDPIGAIFAAQLADRLQQPWVVENRPGAGGLVGLDSVAKATADGHILGGIETSAGLQKWLHKNVPFA